MPRTIDVTGLSPDTIQIIESLIRTLRGAKKSPDPSGSVFDLFGKAQSTKTTAEILEQVRSDRGDWAES